MRPAMLLPAALLLAGCAALGGQSPSPDPEPLDLGGAWVLQRGTGPSGPIVVPADSRFTIRFEGQTVGGQACNHYGGDYRLAGAAIRIGTMSMTEMACREDIMAAESAYHAALAAVQRVARVGDTLTLSGEGTELVFGLLPPVPDAALDGTRWMLESLILGDAVASVEGDAWLRLDPDGTLAGSTGCRELRGTFVIVGDEVVANNLAADGDCPDALAGQDAQVIEVIGDGFTARVAGERLTLLDPNGQGLDYRAAGD